MDHAQGTAHPPKLDEEAARHAKRVRIKELNDSPSAGQQETAKMDSSLKRHTALIKRIRQSMASDNRDHILKDLETLTLEKYIDEIAGAVVEGLGRCKTERDIWGAVEVYSQKPSRLPLPRYSPSAISPPAKGSLSSLSPEQKEKEDSARVTRQRPIVRICAELALVGIIRDAPARSGGEWMMKAMKDLLSNDPSLSSLPLLTTFLKSYSRPFLGIVPPSSSKQVSATSEPGTLSDSNGDVQQQFNEDAELVEQDIRDRFKRMCEGYFESVSKKLVIEHKRLQEQDKRNHEAYIRSGEIFEDRQQGYEKMTRSYEKLLASCQSLSELLYLPLPKLPTSTQKSESIQIGSNQGSLLSENDEVLDPASKWADEEERKFFEDVPDLRDFVPASVLGIGESTQLDNSAKPEDEKEKADREKEEVRKLEEELKNLSVDGTEGSPTEPSDDEDADEDNAPTPTPGTPKATTPPLSPLLAPQGPSQLLTALLAKLPDATNRTLIDQAAVDFAFLNSKAARKRLVKFMNQVPKNRSDLLPHYSRLIGILNPYMSDIGTELVAALDEEFRYLQRKKNVVKEFTELRMKNIAFLSNLTKFKVVPSYLILHMFKVCLDDFAGTNIENLALLLEGCGRFLLRSEDTRERFAAMLELMKRKQSMQHLDQRQQLLLENAYYQCNPPERGPREEKIRPPIELFIRHLIYDVLSKKSYRQILHKVFTKPWKIRYSNVSLLAMLTYDLQRYRPAFAISVVDQVLEDVRRGLEQNVYSTNQRRLATIKYLGELYIYRLLSSGIIFDTLWTILTFGHPEGRPMPSQPVPIDMPDDFFRIRLVCVLLDTCGMCFDRGTQKKKLDNFLTFFFVCPPITAARLSAEHTSQYYIQCKEPLPMDVDFMLQDSIEAIRPKSEMPKTLEAAAIAVDEMFSGALQAAGIVGESSDDSDDEEGGDRREKETDDEEDGLEPESPVDARPGSLEDDDDVIIASNSAQENLGPSDEAEAEFAKELAKMVTDTSAESRKVDKKTALALWDSAVIPAYESETANGDDGMTNFVVLTKRGNKQLTRQIAVQTRTAQLQDKVEQQQLKQLLEELKALEAKHRNGAIKIRLVG
ncbi:transcription factor [Ephemerocybe angulata]|uniref:Transcription factor n=1 Tax=Ephemerocybe angulata TaxID=980116 RepID=A0A8H6M9R0_9AGAR|nr:transcription factor [Tulosesus angulatus]